MRAAGDSEVHDRFQADGTDEVEVLVTKHELSGLIGCTNEAFEAVDDREFDTRGLIEDITDILRTKFRPQ